MKKLILLASLLPCLSYAGLNAAPGLWEMKSEMYSNGKKFDPLSMMRASLKHMPKEQQKKMLDMMVKSDPKLKAMFENKPVKECVTQKMIDEHDMFSDMDKDCKHKVLKNTSVSIKTTYTCKNGEKGEMEWKIKNRKSLEGFSKTKVSGKIFDVKITGKWISQKCNK